VNSNNTNLAREQRLTDVLLCKNDYVLWDERLGNMTQTITTVLHQERGDLEYATDVILSFNTFGQISSISRAVQICWGYNSEQLVGHQVVDLIAESDRASFVETVRHIRLTAGAKALECKVVTANRGEVDTLWSFNWGREEDSMFCIAHDISERKRTENLLKQNEQRIRAIIETIPVGLVVVKESGHIISHNEKFLDLLHCSLCDLENHSIFDFIEHTLDLSQESSTVQPKELLKTALLRNGQKPLPVEISIDVVSLTSGEAILCTIFDISERLKMQEMRNELLQMLTHDLRTPLTSVSGYFQLLAAGAYGEHSKKLEAAASQASRNLSEVIGLVSDLLDVDKIDSGCLMLSLSTTSLKELLREVNGKLAVLAFGKKISLQYQIAHKEIVIEVDKPLILRVLTNTIANAIKFSPPGSSVLIKAYTIKDCAKIEVIDNGCGIAEADQAKVFEPFRQAHQPEIYPSRSSGLGLTICKKIVEAHGGEIVLHSKLGIGTTISFTVPLPLPSNEEELQQTKIQEQQYFGPELQSLPFLIDS
jgi:PAS domain S-box-containing protein